MRTTVAEEFVRYLDPLAGRVERAARSVPQDKLYFKPFRFGNSIGHLILHLTGNLNHYIGAGIACIGMGGAGVSIDVLHVLVNGLIDVLDPPA